MCFISLIEGVEDGEKENEEEEEEENNSGEEMEEDKDSEDESESKFSISIYQNLYLSLSVMLIWKGEFNIGLLRVFKVSCTLFPFHTFGCQILSTLLYLDYLVQNACCQIININLQKRGLLVVKL